MKNSKSEPPACYAVNKGFTSHFSKATIKLFRGMWICDAIRDERVLEWESNALSVDSKFSRKEKGKWFMGSWGIVVKITFCFQSDYLLKKTQPSTFNLRVGWWRFYVKKKRNRRDQGLLNDVQRVANHTSWFSIFFFSLPFSFLRTFSWYEEWNGMERERGRGREEPSTKTENQMFPSLAWNQSIGEENSTCKRRKVVGKSKNASMWNMKRNTLIIYILQGSPLNYVSAWGNIRLQYGAHLGPSFISIFFDNLVSHDLAGSLMSHSLNLLSLLDRISKIL